MLDIRTVQYCILETNGNFSVFLYPKENPPTAKDAGIVPKDQYLPVSIIEDGQLFRENLALSGKDEAWVHATLGKYRAGISGTWLLTVDRSDRVVWIGKEDGR